MIHAHPTRSLEYPRDDNEALERLIMKLKKPQDPTTAPATASGPLAGLVDNKLNTSIVEQIAEELDEKSEEPARSGASDYARGTAEHDDDPDV
jgi:hypothetical protein